MSTEMSQFDPAGSAPVHHAPPNPLLLLHRHLRGRYRFAVPLALFAAVPCAIAGYFALPPLYESYGRIKITPSVPLLLGDGNRPDVMPMFENELNGQAQLATSSRVVMLAVESDRLTNIGWPQGIAGERMLRGSLSASPQRNTNFFVIRVAHENALWAQYGAQAVVDSYMKIYGKVSEDLDERYEELKLFKIEQESEMRSVQSEIETMIGNSEFHVDDLSSIQEAYWQHRIELGFKITNMDSEIAGLKTRLGADHSGSDLGLDDQMLAAQSPEFAALLNDKIQTENWLAKNRNVFEEHPEKKRVLNEYNGLMALIEERREFWRMILAAQPGSSADPVRQYLNDLEADRDRLGQELEGLRLKLNDIESTGKELRRLKQRESRLDAELQRIEGDLDLITLNYERLGPKRTQVVEDPATPLEPTKDRRIPLAVAGGVAGAGLVVLAFLGVSFLDRRLRYVEQLADARLVAPLLGMVPTLQSTRAEQRALAAECVHHLRNLLEIRMCSASGRSIAITSAGPGDGKTSVTAALGMSFAASGRRTLVVDTDLIGRGLSSSFGLGGADGLSELTVGGPLNGEIHETEVPNLWILPAGRDTGMRPEHLGREFTDGLIRQLEQRFSVVLIDTGPLLGSLEANLAASNAASVVLVVSKGQDAKFVQTSLRRIDELGATCLGVVYNRANATDMARSGSAKSGSRSVRTSSSSQAGSAKSALITMMKRDHAKAND